MSSNIHTHKRKNSHLFNEQNTSGSSVRTDYDISIDSMELDNMAPHPIGRTTSISAVPLSNTLPDDLENGQFLDNSKVPSLMSSWDSWYLNKEFGQNRKRVARIIVIIILASFLIFFIPTLFSTSTKDSNDKDNNNDTVKPSKGRTKVNRSFDINDVFKGEFNIDKKTFRFIDPPYLFETQDMDPGLYLTTENIDDKVTFFAKQLFDSEFSKDLGPNRFTINEKEYVVQSIKASYDLNKVIFGTDVIDEFRHSSSALYWIKDIETGVTRPISPYFDTSDPVRLSYVYFSPSYNFIYFVYENNIYFQDIRGEFAPVRLTTDGSTSISNAKTDWIYEEEVLADDKAIWWAPDDSKFIFAKFNDSEVDDYNFPKFVSNEQYNPIEKIKYPKPSRKNPTVELFLYNLGGDVLYSVSMDSKVNEEVILYDADWIGPNNFMFKLTDRYSKQLYVKMFNTVKNELKNTRTIDATSYNGWIEKVKKSVAIPPNEKIGRKEYGYVDVHEDDDGFNHLFYYPTTETEKGTQLTKGDWEVTGKGIIRYEYDTNTILFTANKIGPMSQNLYGVKIDGDPVNNLITLQDPNIKDAFYDFEITSSGRFALMKYMGPAIPLSAAGSLQDVLSYKKVNSDNALILSDEVKRNSIEAKYDMPITSYKSMMLDDGVEIHYVEIKPKNFNLKRKYPLLVNVYGGPGSQTFNTKSSILLEHSVTSSLEAIVLQIEPRGTGGKGWKFRSWATEKLGYWEPRDFTSVTKKFIEDNKAHIDQERVAIWGWSYGGFSTLKTVEYDKGSTFKYAVAVAPVTNWLYYDSIYTERYMGSVTSNIEGYTGLSRVNDVGSFKELNRFMIIHGTADDNVHIQNTYDFVDRLNLGNVENFDMRIFPDSDHSIRFHNAQKLVYKKIYYWLGDAFSGELDRIAH